MKTLNGSIQQHSSSLTYHSTLEKWKFHSKIFYILACIVGTLRRRHPENLQPLPINELKPLLPICRIRQFLAKNQIRLHHQWYWILIDKNDQATVLLENFSTI